MSVTISGSGQIVKQVVNATTSTPTSTTGLTFVNSNLTATITPTATTSKILVLFTASLQTAASNGGGLAIAKNGSIVANYSGIDSTLKYYYVYNGSTGSVWFPISMQYLDSPATTSATTYTIQIASYNSGSSITFPGSGNATNSTGSITLLEISGS